jgi:hypothetical protein
MKTHEQKETEAILKVFEKLEKMEAELAAAKQRIAELEYRLDETEEK